MPGGYSVTRTDTPVTDRIVDPPTVEADSADLLAQWQPRGALQRGGTINLPVFGEPRGNLTFVEGKKHIPFSIERVYYLYDVPGGAHRGGHAHRGLHQLIIAMSGSFDVLLDDGDQKRLYHLNRSYIGLYVAPMVWREIDNFSSGSVCMVLASSRYDEDDYYRDYDEFRVDAAKSFH